MTFRPEKSIVFILMTQHQQAFASASVSSFEHYGASMSVTLFASLVHDLHKKVKRKLKKVVSTLCCELILRRNIRL